MSASSAGPRLVLHDVRLPDSQERKNVYCEGANIAEVTSNDADDLLWRDVQVVEGKGSLLLPAFIDVHSHADGRAWEPRISEPKAQQGIAYEIVGNCGLGPAPSSDDFGWRKIITGVLGGVPLAGDYGTFPQFLDQLQGQNEGAWPALGALVPYGAVRASVSGLRRTVGADDIAQMTDVIDEALAAGAVGVSLGLVYPPNDASTFEELAQTLTPIRQHSAVLTIHIRSQANRWIKAIDEVLRLAERLDCTLLISHLCVGGVRNQWQLDWVLPRLEQARKDGLDVWFDHHPYTAGSTSLTQLLPAEILRTEGEGIMVTAGHDELSDLLNHPSIIEGWENYVELIGAENILLAGANIDGISGSLLSEIQSDWNLDIADTLLRLVRETGGSAAIVLQELYAHGAIERIAGLDFGMISTDGVHGGALPHPRLFGTYPHAFEIFVRAGLMSETEFMNRTSIRPAGLFTTNRRPGLTPGSDADLVLIDPLAFGHETNYLDPAQPVTGINALVFGGAVQHLAPALHG